LVSELPEVVPVKNVVLIGPTGCGKTTIAPKLAEALGLDWVELDDLRWSYYEEIGYRPEQAEEIQKERGIEALMEHWKPFELHSVQRLLEDHPSDHVLAFGGGQSVYAEEDGLRLAADALATSRVVLLLPTEDPGAAVNILARRVRTANPELPDALMPEVESMMRQQFLSASNRSLADHVVFNAELSVDETVQAVLRRVK
jgi:shikimate kinase